MRRTLSLLLIISLLGMVIGALAESDSIEINIHGRSLTLDFDPSATYSFINDGMAQASFYAYVDGSDHLYELYMVFPADVQPGASVTPETIKSEDNSTSVVLIETIGDMERYYLATQMEGTLYPQGSHYAISVESVTDSGRERRFSGHLTASIVELNMADGTMGETLTISNAPFSFALPLDNAPDPNHNPFDDSPEDTPAPMPTPDAKLWKI